MMIRLSKGPMFTKITCDASSILLQKFGPATLSLGLGSAKRSGFRTQRRAAVDAVGLRI